METQKQNVTNEALVKTSTKSTIPIVRTTEYKEIVITYFLILINQYSNQIWL